jgi:arsenate reductase-like glutaredoxin family protein
MRNKREKTMKLTKETLKQIIKEELESIIAEEQSVVKVRNFPSNSGEARYFVRVGDKFYQTQESVAKDIEQNGYDPKKHDYDMSEVSDEMLHRIAPKMK